MNRWRARLVLVLPLLPAAVLLGLVLSGTTNPLRQGGLYSDADIRALAPHDIPVACRASRSLYDVPCLDVVPPGETRPRAEVFRALGVEDRRAGPPQARAEGRVAFVRWRLSRSFDLIYMTGNDDYEQGPAAWAAPDRPVYGIRLVSRADAPDRDWW